MSDFKHSHAAHCESGVLSSMLRHYGLNLSEPMVFGLAEGLEFAYLPFVTLGGMPLIAFRSMPKGLIKKLQKNIDLKMQMYKFSNPKKGEEALERFLQEGKIVGAQTSVFWLEYFPPEMRFHFNAHNLIVYGKKDENTYLISDPVFEHTVECSKKSLQKARFVKGVMAPKGLLYYPSYVPKELDLEPIIKKAIHKTAKRMLKTPVPIAGIKAFGLLASSIRKLKNKDKRYAKLFLGHIIRMQEEIGTGGAGFRYIYASFLKESSTHFPDPKPLEEASLMMVATGDEYREFALMIAKALKAKEIAFDEIADKLLEVRDKEAEVYKKLLQITT